ncbi:N-acyl-D-glucosamine 2-epimerase [Pontibacter qinzhouensis]|uniref:Cellobiose 2-epimerase n=1 Tax=Pontibacter qinzhouensis TaxID=2603253 RepID=A0A5C8KCX2_9BACT|nr:AGE family epimerase/isomerase [Pontibacter qinzhouensis]TXK52628.1 N-acyl-D-glucosamine 2-epimerase [Pontibacter qinzhouensis]
METAVAKARLEVYQAEVEKELYSILDFWMRHASDTRNGGFVGKMDNQGQVDYDAPKGSVLNARILWTFAAAYRHTGETNYLAMADRAFDYVLQHFLDKNFGGVYWSVTATGEPLNTRKQIYALAFMIYGLSEYYLATQKAEALQVCQELFRWVEQYSFDPEQGGYLEAFSREGALLDDLRLSEKDRNDPKTMNTHLHILEAYANLYRIWPDAQLATQLEHLIKVFLEHIIDPDTAHLKLFFSKDWIPAADLVSYGHDIEASWLLVEAAVVLGKEELIERSKEVAVAMANATTEGLQADGSLYHELDKATNHYDTHREWWVSAEAMVGFLNAYQLTNNGSFLEHSQNAWEFARKHLIDKEQGEWLWGVFDDYSPMQEEDKIGFWKCPYHNARVCLEVMYRCDSLLLV